MSVLVAIIVFSLVGGVLSVLAASVFLALPARGRTRLLPHLVSFAIGALLGASLLALLPHALTTPGAPEIHVMMLVVLGGVLGFFVLEKLVLWRHCHTIECEVHSPDEHHHHDHHKQPAGLLIVFGDSVHNFVDGIVIAAAFMTDINLGIVTAVAVAAHEIPQEVGDFAILLQSGYSRKKALVLNVMASLTTVVGALLAYISLDETRAAIPYILAIAAASFLYVAVADLIPGLHKRTDIRSTLQQISLIAAGAATIYFAHSTMH